MARIVPCNQFATGSHRSGEREKIGSGCRARSFFSATPVMMENGIVLKRIFRGPGIIVVSFTSSKFSWE
jgi:hypothetical protein